MHPRVCRCCGGNIPAEVKSANPNVCADCQRLLEDDSPREAATKLLGEQLPEPGPAPEVSLEVEMVPAQGEATHQV